MSARANGAARVRRAHLLWRRSCRGAAAVELLGLLPIVFVVAMAVSQGLVAASAGGTAESAARAAGRAASRGDDPAAAIDGFDGAVVQSISTSGGMVTVTVSVDVAVFAPGWPGASSVSRSATFAVGG